MTRSWLPTGLAPTALAALTILAAGSPVWAAPKDPVVARPTLPSGAPEQSSGVVFFVSLGAGRDTVAIGTAHTLDLRDVTAAGRVEFRLGNSRKQVATSTRFLVPPGVPFFDEGGNVRDDFVIYALDAAPEGVRTLEIDRRRNLELDTRVRIFGVGANGPHDEDDVWGRVAEISRRHIEVDLDVPVDLRGWGGAPVVDSKTGRVIGMVQGAAPTGSIPRVTVAPISGIRTALEGRAAETSGRDFAEYSSEIASRPGRPAPRAQASAPSSTESSASDRRGEPEDLPWREVAVVQPANRPRARVRPAATDRTRVVVEIEYPADGAVISDTACGTFVAGRAMALHGELREFDVALVLDTSASTSDATGADINGNGVIGVRRMGRIGSIFGTGVTDPGDTILAAEVAAARQLLRGLDPRSTRVAVITFAGEPSSRSGSILPAQRKPPAMTLEALTNDFSRVEVALDFILRTEPAGSTHMAAGVDQGTIELIGLPGSRSQRNAASEKLMFFFTDGQPTLPYGPAAEADNTLAVIRAARRARGARIRIHSFAIGAEALAGPIATVEMADLTSGTFTPVRHPGELVDIVDGESFANLGEIVMRSLPAGEDADPFRVTADGSWGGFVKLVPGPNIIELTARSTDGAETRERLNIVFEKDAVAPPIPSDLAVRRNRLLEDCLRGIKQVRVTAEREHAEQVRKDLRVEIERERAKARQRAAEQRKQLRLEAESDEP